jgi:maleate cis-trans isomerase
MEAGLAGERSVLETMQAVTEAVVATTASAALAALRTLNLRHIALFSPYLAQTHGHEIDFLESAGFEIVGGRCLGLSGGDEYIQVSPTEWKNLAESETPDSADGVFLSCTNTHTPEVIGPIEAALDRPVVTSNQAVLWHAMRTLGLSHDVPGLGRLFRVREAVSA